MSPSFRGISKRNSAEFLRENSRSEKMVFANLREISPRKFAFENVRSRSESENRAFLFPGLNCTYHNIHDEIFAEFDFEKE